ncbi:hypothetical protein Snoj_32420 [Streptomyces nojiriensis]|uniref:Uncharacterized protein n=1 Tax=Streptomyces nojiriensis TaxID=66374 RepID=A0ABQ3SMH3_9ACTN|nr:hypothetical protein [Streptomyces nojiriensis]QTI42897.1 hypothetical protein JYK04_00658 [Streptomyces nojiriensis]GGS33424.1 hypothetical protein GCM10010205_74590 [Streptomyces nojiriensis]GHI69324.1 hypothetical protein Snoj_32420 [Streptomyces nojiriensis]
MNPAVLAWLLAQLGPATDQTDLTARYARLASAREVAREVLSERRANLLAEPLRMVVDGVVTIDQSNNLQGLERQLAALTETSAPDDSVAGEPGIELVTAPLVPAHRIR